MNKKTTKILTNLFLFGAFILTYFLDLTGLALHQYLGVAAGVFLIGHILTHAKWIAQVSSRFFQRLSGKVRFYYLLDIALLILIFAMILSGVLISTWLTINFVLYPLIRDIHILVSIAGLALLIIKLALHWKFFANLSKRVQSSFRTHQVDPLQPAAGRAYSRRDAIKTIGGIAVVGIFGLYKAGTAMAKNVKPESLPAPSVTIAKAEISDLEPAASASESNTLSSEPTHEPQGGGRQRRRGQDSPASASENSQDNMQVTPQTTPENSAIDVQPTAEPDTQEACVIRCPRACAFPGQCGHYIDENHNRLCDLGECLVI